MKSLNKPITLQFKESYFRVRDDLVAKMRINDGKSEAETAKLMSCLGACYCENIVGLDLEE